MDIVPTKHGLRLSQHGVVISELRATAGPTHSVFDVLAAVIAALASPGRIGVLGFAGGGMMAPLAALGVETTIESVDLDRTGYCLFREHCPEWVRRVKWEQGDAVAWLRRQKPEFGLLLDDLSVPDGGDVLKPEISWNFLPNLIRRRLRPAGIAVFNLMPLPGGRWNPELANLVGEYRAIRVVELDDFVNRILIAGHELPSARALGRRVRLALSQLGSRQQNRIQVRTVSSTP